MLSHNCNRTINQTRINRSIPSCNRTGMPYICPCLHDSPTALAILERARLWLADGATQTYWPGHLHLYRTKGPGLESGKEARKQEWQPRQVGTLWSNKIIAIIAGHEYSRSTCHHFGPVSVCSTMNIYWFCVFHPSAIEWTHRSVDLTVQLLSEVGGCAWTESHASRIKWHHSFDACACMRPAWQGPGLSRAHSIIHSKQANKKVPEPVKACV